jgi:hypothetical protein
VSPRKGGYFLTTLVTLIFCSTVTVEVVTFNLTFSHSWF